MEEEKERREVKGREKIRQERRKDNRGKRKEGRGGNRNGSDGRRGGEETEGTQGNERRKGGREEGRATRLRPGRPRFPATPSGLRLPRARRAADPERHLSR